LKKTFMPIVEGIKSVFDNVKTAVMNSKDEFKAFWEVVKFIAPLIGSTIGKALSVVGEIAEVVITIIAKVLGAIKPLLNTAIDGINLIIKGYNAIQFGKDVSLIPKIGATPAISGTAGFSGTMPGGQSFTTSSGSSSGSSGGIANAAKIAASTTAAASRVVSSNSAATRSAGSTSAGTTINLSVNGAMDKEGTARTIVETLNNSFYRGTGGASALVLQQ
jgi:hypothetical protein